MIETKPLCASLSNLAELLSIMREINHIDFGGHGSKFKVTVGIIEYCWVRGKAMLCVVIFLHPHPFIWGSVLLCLRSPNVMSVILHEGVANDAAIGCNPNTNPACMIISTCVFDTLRSLSEMGHLFYAPALVFLFYEIGLTSYILFPIKTDIGIKYTLWKACLSIPNKSSLHLIILWYMLYAIPIHVGRNNAHLQWRQHEQWPKVDDTVRARYFRVNMAVTWPSASLYSPYLDMFRGISRK